MIQSTAMKLMAAATVVLSASSFVNVSNDWAVFRSEEGRFSISFPKDPTPQEQEVPSAIGNLQLKMFSYDASADNEANQFYMASYIDYPDSLVNADNYSKEEFETFYNDALSGAAGNVKGKISGKKNIKLGNHEGREVKITFDSEGATYVMNIQVYVIKNRMYMNQVICSKKKDNNANIKTFFSSFKLI